MKSVKLKVCVEGLKSDLQPKRGSCYHTGSLALNRFGCSAAHRDQTWRIERGESSCGFCGLVYSSSLLIQKLCEILSWRVCGYRAWHVGVKLYRECTQGPLAKKGWRSLALICVGKKSTKWSNMKCYRTGQKTVRRNSNIFMESAWRSPRVSVHTIPFHQCIGWWYI